MTSPLAQWMAEGDLLDARDSDGNELRLGHTVVLAGVINSNRFYEVIGEEIEPERGDGPVGQLHVVDRRFDEDEHFPVYWRGGVLVCFDLVRKVA